MKLHILSDLHLEFGNFQPPHLDLEYDVVVLAGDIQNGEKGVTWAARDSVFRPGVPVIYVPGNHEFYDRERQECLGRMREAARGTRVHVLDRDELVVDGVRFLGATFWTDFECEALRGLTLADAMIEARAGMTDYRLIREGKDRFRPADALREHKRSRDWLRARLGEPGDMPTVVVTHHAPSRRSIAATFFGDNLNACFASQLPDDFFGRAALWIHGHMHNSSDYDHQGTRVVANPRGYMTWRGPENDTFDPALVIQL